jgi:site-specific recombinase XerD
MGWLHGLVIRFCVRDRHSFASLLLAEGRTVHYVAAQLGHSPALTLSTYGHLIAEYEDVAEITTARSHSKTVCAAA